MYSLGLQYSIDNNEHQAWTEHYALISWQSFSTRFLSNCIQVVDAKVWQYFLSISGSSKKSLKHVTSEQNQYMIKTCCNFTKFRNASIYMTWYTANGPIINHAVKYIILRIKYWNNPTTRLLNRQGNQGFRGVCCKSVFYLSRAWAAKARSELPPTIPIHSQIPGLPEAHAI